MQTAGQLDRFASQRTTVLRMVAVRSAVGGQVTAGALHEHGHSTQAAFDLLAHRAHEVGGEFIQAIRQAGGMCRKIHQNRNRLVGRGII